MAIANIRFSLEGDYGSATTNRCRGVLRDYGFVNVSTGSYTAEGPMHDLLAGIAALTDELVSAGAAPVDHLWVQLGKRWNDAA
ncbi:hypothetical protein BIU98_04415 [Curtobacterium sp. MMLR14_010]|uniref:hypothetical protein n=1 Tax=Curtobacterium sp. MMLR14_010 TaxID=1898743 RepID=UPI0008DD5ED6|nr:hypothetical protein [Curtobacterium sp. MMLR14_010]OII35171.1 hypothetical protein BIU98_04415 [Curtobacterium sp. MMLR14_010]